VSGYKVAERFGADQILNELIERGIIMPRIPNVGYAMKNSLKEQVNYLNDNKEGIGIKSFETYEKVINHFEKYVHEQTGTKRITLEDSIKYIQSYIDQYNNANTQNTKISALAKATHTNISDYRRLERHYADTIRGVEKACHDEYNEIKARDCLDLNRAVGVRRAELARIDINKDIRYNEHGQMEVHTPRAKGGKYNINTITIESHREIIEHYIQLAKAEGRTTLVSREMLNNDADLHNMRAEHAKDTYREIIEDMERNPERRDFYKAEIDRAFADYNAHCREGKEKTVPKNLDNPYHCRGYNKEILAERGIETVFDRTAVLYVSTHCLGHFREDTTVQHYLTK